MSGDMDFRRELGQQLRVASIRSSDAAGSGHPTSSMSAADLLAVLIDGHLRLDFDTPDDPRNDHLIFSKGHASPLYYSILKAVGAIEDDEVLTFRKLGSRLACHPTPLLPWGDVAPRRRRLARGGPADRRRRRRRGADGADALARLGPLRRFGDGRGFDLGGGRARRQA